MEENADGRAVVEACAKADTGCVIIAENNPRQNVERIADNPSDR
jgi:hypothetical protein